MAEESELACAVELDEARARIAELGAMVLNQQALAQANVDLAKRAERAEAERDDYKSVAIDAAKDQARLTAERDVAIELVTMARQTFDADGNGTRFLSEMRDDVIKDVKRLVQCQRLL